MNKNFYITTPIYYVNGSPHIGHAYTSIICDVLARFKRLEGQNVKFLTGTDEHGQKIEKTAKEQGRDPHEFVEEVSKIFRELGNDLNISNDDFIRTTEDRHKKCATTIWQKLTDNGHIYKDKYSGWYSVRDEAFYNESELTHDKKAPTGAKVEWVEEESYFFDLSKWQSKLLDFYQENPNFIYPKSRRNEVISFVKGGLNDLSISRSSFNWGIKVPDNHQHVMYVWLDALTNYLSALGYPDENAQDFKDFWPCNIHMIGKDILRFHAVYWPAFLMAADLPLPRQIVAHGWWIKEGQKISKSEGNVIVPSEIIKEFGLDQFRYFLLKEITLGNDGDYTREAMISRVNSDLSNKIGNMIQRSLSMIYKNCERMIPSVKDDIYERTPLLQKAEATYENMLKSINIPELSSALAYIIELADDANIYIDEQAPWALKKSDPEKMEEVLYVIAEVSRYIGILLQPFIPASACKILDLLEVEKNNRDFSKLSRVYRLKGGVEISKPEGVFPRFERLEV